MQEAMKKKGALMRRIDAWADKSREAAAAATAFVACNGGVAYGASANDMLGTIMNLAVSAVSLFGGALVVWGGVKFGLAIKDQQGGNAIAESLATLAGGAIIIAAGNYFGTLRFDG